MERREILYGLKHKKTPEYAAIGDAYFDAGRRQDALQCYTRIKDADRRLERLHKVRTSAIKDGTWFLLKQFGMYKLPVTSEEWLEAAKAAKAAGKLNYALKNAELAGEESLVAELRETLGIGKPTLPEGMEESEGEEEAEEPEDEA